MSIRTRIRDAAICLFARKGGDRVTISELADEAGVARGTVYNTIPDPGALFEDIAGDLAREMQERVVASMAGLTDPALRLSCGVRLFIRRAHEEPHWGRFLVRFSLTNRALQGLLTSSSTEDILKGVEQGRYIVPREQVTSVVAMIGGTTLAAMLLVQEGHRAWREAGSEAAELLLVALGVDRQEARAVATQKLPPLSD
ncbi:TetR/AcrR family transcriptional regulator [Ciceribacter thiooxidans]|uniref:TetR/AcrR family transcriptional regulator n=1 Tax=Ciceribacter thiooxidans TaxID=1969821 RepID=A0ABV7I4J6_9HYPH|nr:TetR/AcrR family transcriptional regulator [Ciceribacter thiooxidans]MDI6836860.1 TetR/AcrR family transcriptional regulator [Rhizobiaceae bacterium]